MRLSFPKVGRPKFGRPHLSRARFGRPRVALAAPSRPRLGSLRPGARFERFAWLPAGAAISAVVVLASVYSGSVRGTDVTLVLMGFDPDRAQLITALVFSAVAAGAAALVVNRIGYPSILGIGALVAMFAETFGAETQNAAGSRGATGTFDLGGWMLTLVTLLVIGFVASWAGATLAAAVRPGLIVTGRDVRDALASHRPSLRLVRRPLAALLVLVLLAVTVPAFSDMVNLSPDALMLQGNQGIGLVNNFTPPPFVVASSTPTPAATPGSTASGSGVAGTPIPTPSPTPMITAAPGTKPWLAWKPTGTGHVTLMNMPAPWIGGDKSTSEIDVYTPPGYDPASDRRYPVIFEAPTGLTLWNKGTSILDSLDTLIDAGEMPAAIVVFIDSLGPPYGDTECADMPNYQQWFETYISTTVVYWVDHHFNTIRDPRARAVMGMSAGGFCAPMLAIRHPDVFSVSISFSGYFWAGAAGPNAAFPFGSTIEAHSPAQIAPKVPTVDRARTFFIIVADPTQEFYGSGAAAFEQILKTSGYKYLNIDSLYTHGWPQVRYETPGVLAAWGAQLVINGIW